MPVREHFECRIGVVGNRLGHETHCRAICPVRRVSEDVDKNLRKTVAFSYLLFISLVRSALAGDVCPGLGS
jgi:hypothetical protein